MCLDLLLAAEFPSPGEHIQLNHAGVAPWPRRTVTAVSRFAGESHTLGPAGYEGWLRTEEELRRQLCRLIKAGSPEDIALLKNTSEGLSV